MFQIVRADGGWQVRSPLVPIECQFDTFRTRRKAVESMRALQSACALDAAIQLDLTFHHARMEFFEANR